MQSLYLPRGKAVIAALVAIAGCTACVVVTPPERWLAGCFLSVMLAWAALIDIDRMILPNLVTLPLLMAGLVNAAWTSEPGVLSALVGVAVGYFVFTVLGQVFAWGLGRSALGNGDTKLLSACGGWLGWEWLPYVTLIASSSALLLAATIAVSPSHKLPEGRMAFGPHLALALIVGWLLVNWAASW